MLPNDDVFAELWAFFSNVRAQKVELACALSNTNFFLVPTSAVLRHSDRFCPVRFGAALPSATLRDWWKRTLRILYQ